MAHHTFDSSNTRYNIERILKLLATPQTYTEMEAALHMSPRSVRFYIQHLRNQDSRRVYLHVWRLTGGRYHAAFKVGSRADTKQPKMTTAQQNAKWRAKVKASEELTERSRRYEAARWMASKAVRTPNTWCAPVMGSTYA